MEVNVIEPILPVNEDYSQILRQYYLTNQVKLKAEKEVKKFKEILERYMKELPTDTLGNSYFEAEGLLLKRRATARVKTFNEKAEKLLKEKKIYEDFLVLQYDKEKIDELIDTGVLTQEEVEDIVDISIIYCSSIKEV